MTKILLLQQNPEHLLFANRGLSNLPDCITHFTKEIRLTSHLKNQKTSEEDGIVTRMLNPEIVQLPTIAKKICIANSCSAALSHRLIDCLTFPLSSNTERTEFIATFFNPIFFIIVTQFTKPLSHAVYFLWYFKSLKYKHYINRKSNVWLSNIKSNKAYENEDILQKCQSVLYLKKCLGKNMQLLSRESHSRVLKETISQSKVLLS